LELTEITRNAFDNIIEYKTNNMKQIYKELQEIEEFEANFNPTKESKQRKEYLLAKLALKEHFLKQK